MPRPKGDSPQHPQDALHALIDELLADAPERDWRHDPALALELLAAGEVSAEDRVRMRDRAQEVLRHVEWTNHLVQVGAIFTSPLEAAERGRVQRDRDAVAWRRVVEAAEGLSA